MKVAVIIVNYNDVEDTEKYVNKITKYDVVNRIVVVDNMSTIAGTFETLQKLESEKVRVIQSPKNGGYNFGNNYGIRFLKSSGEEYDYYIISNPDIEVTEEAIKHCIEIGNKDSKIGVIAPRMFNKEGNPIRRSSWKKRTFWLDVVHSTRILELIFYKILRNGEYSEKEYETEILEVEAISGAFFLIKSEVLNKINLFDEEVFLFYEEDILAKTLYNEGYKTISLNSEKFIHFESQTIGKTFNYFRKMKQLFISKMYYHKKYNKINLVQIIVFHILNICRKIELLIEVPIRKLLKK